MSFFVSKCFSVCNRTSCNCFVELRWRNSTFRNSRSSRLGSEGGLPYYHNPVSIRHICEMTWTVYILLCNDNSHYVGCTSNLDDRLKRHGRGEVKYTSTRLPVKLLTYIVFQDKYKAYEFEKYLKSGTGSAFMYKRLVKRD